MAAERWPPPASLRCSPWSLRTQLGGRRPDVRLPLAVGPWTPGSGLRARPTALALGLCGSPAGASSGHSGAPVSLSEKRWEGAVPRPPPRMGPAIIEHSGWKRAKQPAGHPARRGARSLTRRGGLRVSRARSAGDSKTKPGLQPRLSRSRGTGQAVQALRVAGTPKAKCRRRRDRARGLGRSAGRRAAPGTAPSTPGGNAMGTAPPVHRARAPWGACRPQERGFEAPRWRVCAAV